MHLESLKVEVKMRYSQSRQFQLGIYRPKRRLFSEEKEEPVSRNHFSRKHSEGPKGLAMKLLKELIIPGYY